MEIRHEWIRTLVGLLVLMTGSPVMAADKVGSVHDFDPEAFVIREAEQAPVNINDDILLGDKLGVEEPHAWLLVALTSNGEEFPVTISHGSLRLAGQGELTEIEMIEGNGRFQDPPIPVKSKDMDRAVATGTLFEVFVLEQDTRVYVYDGKVDVFSTAVSAFPDGVEVQAGQWVRARRGENIEGPYRFIVATGPGSGSGECIYSNCKITDKVPIPPPPAYTPPVLTPPPPNPPGQR